MDKILELPVTVYGEITKFNDVLSKSRCRTFYKFGNRNGTYITENFAQMLIDSAPYTPVKGIFDSTANDFTDHGNTNQEGRVYGFIPENPNFAWEKHYDKDNVEREYACFDVLLLTGLYPEAKMIVGKSQSMELYPPTLQYHTETINNQKWIVFDSGCLFGLQALGDDVEPCFEGAAFYSFKQSMIEIINQFKQFTQEAKQMDKINFNLSDDEKFQLIWYALNPNYSEEGNWTCDYAICDVYDEYVLAFNYADKQYERVYYTKDNDAGTVAIGEKVHVYVIDVTESEKNTLDMLKKLNNDTYTEVNDNLVHAEENFAAITEKDSKIVELTDKNVTLETELSETKDQVCDIADKFTAAQTEIDQLNTKVEELTNYKLEIEKQQKDAVIAQYKDKLSEDVINSFVEKLGEYTVLELDKELAYQLKTTNFAIYDNNNNGGFLPKDQPLTGIEAILAKHMK